MNKCVLPFIEHDFDKGKPCCMLTNYDHQKDFHKLLSDHTSNVKSSYCQSCWQHEKIGIKSKRISHNESFPQYLNLEKPILKSVVVSTGNICNLYCVTCGVGNSTGWKPKKKFMNSQTDENKIQPTNAFKSKNDLDNIDWSEIENVEFLGGETLYSKDLWILIKKLKKDTKISLLTNGTIKLDQVQMDIIKEYKHMHITFSLDGVDKIFEYLRQPAEWSQVKENIKNYKEVLGVNNLGINLTISNMNILYIDKIFLELSKIISKKHSYFFVEKPEVFAVSNLPPNVGKIIEEKNPYFFSKNKIAWTGNEESMKKFLENINLQDQFSNRFLKDYLPELYQLIQAEVV